MSKNNKDVELIPYNRVVYDDKKLEMLITDIGRNVYKERIKKNITPKQLCVRANLSAPQLYKIETGQSHIGLLTLIKIGIGLETSPDLLIPSEYPCYNFGRKFELLTKDLNTDSINYILEVVEKLVDYKMV